jgi:N-acetylmuramoyl-L-alanine amidase
VNLSNAQRAQIANRAKASLFLRIHMNGSPSARQAGLSTLYPAVTRWTKATSAPSRRAAAVIQQSALSATGAPSDGLHARSDLAGFNWCTRPSVLVECGYMSNRVEDRLLASPKYQDKVAAGITRGVLAYLGR